MIIKFPIFNFSDIQELVNASKTDMENIEKLMMDLNSPLFKVREVLDNSKLINDWVKAGLIDVQEEGVSGSGTRQWHRFSFIEAIWIKFIEELRKFGVSLKEIQELKEYLFPRDAAALRKYFTELMLIAGDEIRGDVKELGRKLLSQSDKVIEDEMRKLNYNIFQIVIMLVLLFKFNLGFYIDEDGGYMVLLDKPISEVTSKSQKEIFLMASRKSFVLINLKSLVTKFLDNDLLDKKEDFFFGIMNDKEREIIEKLRSGIYKQVTIKLEGDNVIQLRLTKNTNDSILINKIQRLLKRGDFKQIEIISRDGEVVKLEETDIVKMDDSKPKKKK